MTISSSPLVYLSMIGNEVVSNQAFTTIKLTLFGNDGITQITNNYFSNTILYNEFDIISNLNTTINMQNNWWGSSDLATIESKIYHIIPVDFSNPMLSPDFTCLNVGNCNGRGACVRQNVCSLFFISV